MRRPLRTVGIVAALLLGFIVVSYVGLRAYLNTSAARRMAADQLAAVIGGPVEVQSLRTGLAGDTQVGLALPAAGQDAPLVAGVVTANVSLLDLARGTRPTEVTVEGASVTLRFDKDGKLLTQLPAPPKSEGGGAIPAVTVRGGTLTLAQEGRPPFTVTGLDATVADHGGKLTLSGTICDQNWGDWSANGTAASDGSTASVTLATARPNRVAMPLLRSIPFVPANTWEEVELDGTTTGTVRLGLDKGGAFTYRVELQPAGTRVTVHPIDLTTTDTAGRVLIDGPKVELSGVTGHTADGQVKVDGTLDFRPDPSQLRFKVSAQGLDVKQLPKSWNLPQQIGGRLKGRADLTLAVGAGKVDPRGSGKAVIEGATVAGFPAELVELRLVGDGRRYRFEGPPPKLSNRMPDGWERRLFVGCVEALRNAPRDGPPRVAVVAGPVRFVAEPPQRTLRKSGGLAQHEATLTALLAVMLQPPPAKAEPPKKDPPAKSSEPTYVQANLRLRDVDLAELLKRLNVSVPVRLAGKVSLAVSAEIPVTDAGTLRAYRIRGQVSSPRLEVEGLVLDKLTADIDFREGVLSLSKLSGTIPPEAGTEPGTFVGTAKYGVDPRTDLTADLTLDRIPLGQVFKAAPTLAGTASGVVSGKVVARIPGDKLTDVSAIVADGTLTSPGVTVFSRRAENVRVGLGLRDGVARITGLDAVVEGLPVTGSADLTLSGQYPYTAAVKVNAVDAVAIRRLVPEAGLPVDVTGKLDATATASGTVSPATVKANGTVSATTLTVGTATLDRVSTNWAVDPDAFTLTDLKADVYGGTITGSGRYPLKGDAAGTFKLTATGLDTAVLTRQVPSLPVKLDGKVNGTLTGELPAAKGDTARRATAALNLEAPRLRVNGIPATKLRGNIDYRPGAVGYKLTGDALGGDFDLEGTYPLTGGAGGEEPPAAAGSLRVTNVLLGRLAGELNSRSLAPLRGRLSATVRYDLAGPGGPVGSGRAQIAGFAWGDEEPSDLQAFVRIAPDAVELTGLSGQVAGGQLRGRVRYNLANPRRSFFSLTLDGADATALLAPLGGPPIDARVGIALRGSIGRELRGTGTLTAGRATVEGFPLADLRVPFDWQAVPGGGAEVTFHEGSAQSGGGRVTGRGSVRAAQTTRVDLHFRFLGLSVRSVLGSSSLGGSVSGRLNGSFDLTGSDVRTVRDLTGQLAANFGGEAGAQTVPVFRALTPYLAPGSFARLTDGDIRARLANGVFRVNRLTLTGPSLRLFADGNVGLNGQLDLAVVARTGQIGPNQQLLRLFRISVPALGPIPLAVLVEVTNYLSNRTVRLRVTGTVDRPAVQVNTAALLAEEAVRYFFGPYLPSGR
ncbi:MAG: AsmA-like C-terminal region-containing protein [Gemmataceae bacterium]